MLIKGEISQKYILGKLDDDNDVKKDKTEKKEELKLSVCKKHRRRRSSNIIEQDLGLFVAMIFHCFSSQVEVQFFTSS